MPRRHRIALLITSWRSAWLIANGPWRTQLTSRSSDGNPIPGYQAPEEITLPLARRPFLGMFRWFISAHQTGELTIPAEYRAVPPSMAEGVAAWRRMSGIEVADPLMGLLMSGWARIYGIVMLELFHHIQPLIGDPGEFYRYELEAMLRHLGLKFD